MADSSSPPLPPPSFLGYLNHYSSGFPAPAYGMGGRGELVMTVSGGGSPENAVVWTTVAEPGHWFYVPPSGQYGGAIMINSAAVTGDATGITGTGIGTGVFIPERPRLRRMKHPINWVPLVPDRGGNGRKPELKTANASKGKGIQMSYAAAVKTAGPSHEAVRANQSKKGHKFSRQKKSAATAAVEAPAPEKKEEATATTVEDIPELALLPEEWVY
uniref:Uncharacterized protein n=1 Tax=Oryza glumipatula TaxID=40148 RepID=A0A0E0BFK5_9ORYZ